MKKEKKEPVFATEAVAHIQKRQSEISVPWKSKLKILLTSPEPPFNPWSVPEHSFLLDLQLTCTGSWHHTKDVNIQFALSSARIV